MTDTTPHVTPKQAARALGVSESSLKRWCDQGLIPATRTAGGHRRLSVADVLRFTREHDFPVVSPEVLGLPSVSEATPRTMSRAVSRFAEALLAGDEAAARQIVFDLFLARERLSVIFDDVVAAAFRRIGELWACHEAEVYQERRGCEITLQILFELRRLQVRPDPAWRAIGGTLEGDPYMLPHLMAELVLRDAGFHASTLGHSIPCSSLIRAVEDEQPHVLWLSVSHIREGLDLVGEINALWRACAARGVALVVGGRALTAPLRRRLTYSAYCDRLQQLEAFAGTLLASLKQASKSTRLREK